MSTTPTMTSYNEGRLAVWGGDCLALMAALPPDSVDAIVTDPPYGLGFMGKKWDDLPPGKEWAEACYRVLKPGGHLLAFGGTRTWHRLAVAIEDGGFEIRDSLAWLYGSGFPKSMDVSKAIDKAAGAEREVVGSKVGLPGYSLKPDQGRGVYSADGRSSEVECAITAAATPEAEQWEGWGTALKPAFEPIVVGRKPLGEKTVAANVLAYGTGALNIDACRVASSEADKAAINAKHAGMDAATYDRPVGTSLNLSVNPMALKPAEAHAGGRWPANVILDASQAEALDAQSGVLHTQDPKTRRKGRTTWTPAGVERSAEPERHYEVGGLSEKGTGASRFFYCAKAPKSERPVLVLPDGTKLAHPTVKPVAVMRWLVRLVTPPDGLVLDTFAGTGTTGEACVLEGFRCLLAEDPTKGEQDYLPLIDQRILRAVAALPKTETQEQTA